MAIKLFVTGIGTEVGKTVVSAILTKALGAAYWKPVQAGDLEDTDSHKVKAWTDCPVFSEQFRLRHPMSPHAAAELDQVDIKLEDFQLPVTTNNLIVEGAGGLLVPLNDQQTMLDLIAYLQLPVVLVSRHYLGSINHTLLSVQALHQRGIQVAGLVFNGPKNPATEDIILKMSGVKVLFHLPELPVINKDNIAILTKELLTPEVIQVLEPKK